MTSQRDAKHTGDFAGRHVLITGGASGIGRATAVMLAERGAKTAILDVDDAKLKEVAAQTDAVAIRADLTDEAALVAAVETAAKAMGALDGIVNCAGVATREPLPELTPALWARAVAVNLTAPYLICRTALPYLLAAKGASIVNIASGVGLLPTKGSGAAYSSTKAGLIGLTRVLAAELAPDIRVNAICPGLTATPMVSFLLDAQAEKGGPSPAAAYALGQAADPSEIASAIAFLLGDGASFVTGSTLGVDGGRIFH